MRIARVRAGDAIGFGVIEGDQVALLDGPPIGEIRFSGDRVALSDVRVLAPVLPSKIVAISGNYPHGRDGGVPPSEPLLFLKPSTAVIGPDEAIRIPATTTELMHEVELAVVVAGLVRNADVRAAGDSILGYTVGNDVTAADLQANDGQWTRAKGFDTFCPLGPWIETALEPDGLRLEARVDGTVEAEGSTKDMFWRPAELVSFVSKVMTLLPGDVVLTGTPARVGPTAPGAVVELSIEAIGTLRNPVTG